MMKRRSFVLQAAAAAAIATCTLPVDAKFFRSGAVSGPPPATGLTVEITFPGGSPTASTLIYDIANGTDMGDYVAPTAGFTQQCIRVRHASLANYFVDFRPDTTGGRIEVVFWNGEVLGTVASSTFRNLPAYNAVVKLNGVAQTDINRGTTTQAIPYHYWGNRWRFQSATRSIVRTPSQVFSGGYLPNMSLTAARYTGYSGTIVPTAPSVPSPSNNNGTNGDGTTMISGPNGYLYTFPMITGTATRIFGISCNGDNGGAGEHEGLVTKWQGDWLLNSTASSLNTFMQQAEFFSCQANAVFLPDQVVGGPINQKADLTHYKVSSNNYYGSYYKAINGGYGLGLSSGGFTGSVSGTTLTVTSSPGAGPILAGMVLKAYADSGVGYDTLLPGTYVVTQLTQTAGTPGDTGTYQLSRSQSGSAPALMICWGTTGEYQSKGDEHSPQAWYLPWVITEDPFYIEGAQFHETFALQADIYYKETVIGKLDVDATGASGINGAFTLPPAQPATSEERAIGWSVKNIASCYKISPASPPSWLLSSGYWGTVSSDTSTFIDWLQTQEPTNQFYTVFHSVSFSDNSDTPQTFYKAYVAYCFGFADLVGLPVPAASGHSAPSSWLTQLTYMFDFIRKTTDSALASGWNVQSPIINDTEPPTWMSNKGGAASGCTVGTPTVRPSGTNCVDTYPELWTYAGAYAQDTAAYPSNPSPGYIGHNPGNLGPLVAGIAVAKSRGVTGAAACFAWINAMIDYTFPQAAYNDISFQQQDAFDGT